MSDNEKLPMVRGFISHTDKERLDYFTKDKNTTASRLIGIAVHKELKRDNPFEFNCTLPEDEIVEYAYVDQAGKILKYLKGQHKPITLELLMLVREDIGVPDEYEFLMAFKDCIEKKMLNKQIIKEDTRANKKGTVVYILPENCTTRAKQVRKKASKYQKYQKLKKEFGDT